MCPSVVGLQMGFQITQRVNSSAAPFADTSPLLSLAYRHFLKHRSDQHFHNCSSQWLNHSREGATRVPTPTVGQQVPERARFSSRFNRSGRRTHNSNLPEQTPTMSIFDQLCTLGSSKVRNTDSNSIRYRSSGWSDGDLCRAGG